MLSLDTRDGSDDFRASPYENLTRFQHRVIPPSPPPTPPKNLLPSTILITGGTGFLGKLVIEALFRRQSEFPFDRIVLLTRGKRGQDPQARFRNTVATSPCFSNLSPSWMDQIQIVEGDVAKDNCGMRPELYREVCRDVTHIIHCAASIKFDNPIKDAMESNIGGAVNVCLLANQCKRLERLLMTSTAYVTPHTRNPIGEELAPLPLPVDKLKQIINEGKISESEILKLTGHENTYTLTKCMAEHYIDEWSKTLPITIVRPSIISASRKFPFPGWIDSPAAFAGLVIGLSSGMLKVLDGSRSVKLDVVPVDDVAAEIINQTFVTRHEPSRIAYAVSTLTNALDIDETGITIMTYFNQTDSKPAPKIMFCKHKSIEHRFLDICYHRLPLMAGKFYYSTKRNEAMKYKIGKLSGLISAVNRAFPYFCHNTFDFRPQKDLYDGEAFDTQAYVVTVCKGVQEHILNQRRAPVASTKKKGGKATKGLQEMKQTVALSEREIEQTR
ncbi:hypothetical protein HYFRA_00013943 [Hymenoscyphus fraxineus]|uniref:Fatty acyl-CoA reductase n=1 Tax=Hymenoscyphus fraxineus TaxID=746836 RepID=A0A9N9L794_9HELO|nr:hypothetical protein HYFRA_00013943 [Hymenoscyphus fraxineus]